MVFWLNCRVKPAIGCCSRLFAALVAWSTVVVAVVMAILVMALVCCVAARGASGRRSGVKRQLLGGWE